MTCPECNKESAVKIGKRMTRRGKVQLYQCNVCGRRFQDQYKADSSFHKENTSEGKTE